MVSYYLIMHFCDSNHEITQMQQEEKIVKIEEQRLIAR